MDRIRIEGGKALCGSVYIQGSKNAALPVMAAAVLHKGITVLKNCPRITDVRDMEQILKNLGAETYWEDHTLTLDCRNIVRTNVPMEYGSRMRSSVILMGSLLGRMKEVTVPYPGGCTIGRRPVDLHLKVFRQMGVQVEEREGMLHAACGRIRPAEYLFPFRSVGATENAILAAAAGEGETVLKNCAIEPEITHLCRFLNKMGICIEGAGTDRLAIKGGTAMRDTVFAIPPDRIAAGTYLFAGAITRGKVVLEDAPAEELDSILKVYEKMGGQYYWNSGKLVTDSRHVGNSVSYVETASYPGFPTDMQSVLMSVLATARGDSVIREQIFEERFKIVSLLNRMGARILVDGRDALIHGVETLKGQHVFAEELRGGAALVLAGLAAEGITVIDNPHFIRRGYENFCENLAALGGNITIGRETFSI
ncbi:MAG: UDP-N-acetylglucosamine 1-carboxyvinyltransferase [Ruminococcus sp.]